MAYFKVTSQRNGAIKHVKLIDSLSIVEQGAFCRRHLAEINRQLRVQCIHAMVNMKFVQLCQIGVPDSSVIRHSALPGGGTMSLR